MSLWKSVPFVFLSVPAGPVFSAWISYSSFLLFSIHPGLSTSYLFTINGHGYWVFDQGHSSGLAVSFICWNLMSFNLWEWSTSFLLDQISLIYKGSFLNGMELQGWFLFAWAQNIWVFISLACPRGSTEWVIFTDLKNKSIDMRICWSVFAICITISFLLGHVPTQLIKGKPW